MEPTSLLSAEAERFRAAICAGLETPLSALRASLEALAGDGRKRDPAVEGALREVLLLARGVRELGEFAAPPVPRPLRCSAEEIAYAARYQLGREARERVWVAREVARGVGALVIDGPVLSRSLSRLLQFVLESGAERALVRTRRDGARIVFAIVGDGPGIDAGAILVPFAEARDRGLGLGPYLACRDLELLGGALEVARGPLGDTCIVACVPEIPGQSTFPPALDARPVTSGERVNESGSTSGASRGER